MIWSALYSTITLTVAECPKLRKISQGPDHLFQNTTLLVVDCKDNTPQKFAMYIKQLVIISARFLGENHHADLPDFACHK